MKVVKIGLFVLGGALLAFAGLHVAERLQTMNVVNHPQLLVRIATIGAPLDDLSINGVQIPYEKHNIHSPGDSEKDVYYYSTRVDPGRIEVAFLSPNGEPIRFQFEGQGGKRDEWNWVDYTVSVMQNYTPPPGSKDLPLNTNPLQTDGTSYFDSAGAVRVFIARAHD